MFKDRKSVMLGVWPAPGVADWTTTKIKPNLIYLDVLKIIYNFVLGPPLPRGVPGEGPDCHFPKEIVGFGPIPARILGFSIFILALSTATTSKNVFLNWESLVPEVPRILGGLKGGGCWLIFGRFECFWEVCCPISRNNASKPEIGFPGVISAGFYSGKHNHRPAGRPKAGRRAKFEAVLIRIRPKSGSEARFPARKHNNL